VKYRVRHITEYDYGEKVPVCQNEARLKPRHGATQMCISSNLTVSPRPATIAERNDYFGNHVTFFTIQEGHKKLSITAESVVTLVPPPEPNPMQALPWEQIRGRLADRANVDLLEARHFAYASPYVPIADELADYARPSFAAGRSLLEAVLDLTHRINVEFKFDPRTTTVTTTPLEVLRIRKGVCQDFAHLQIGCLRSLGLAARYVSGYLQTDPPLGKPRLVGADVSHAWIAVYFPEFGWLEFDPTNDLMPSTRHVTLGWGRDYGDIAPIKGVFTGGGAHTMRVSVDVEAI
jgi:transglutaminase-like putative cysteine protease